MKFIFLPLFKKNKNGQSPKQIVFRRPSKIALEAVVENYIKWRFPGAIYCHEVKGRPWSLRWYHYEPEQNTMELSVLLYIDEDYFEEISVHLYGDAFVG